MMDVTEASTGSGTNELMALRVGGTDKFTINNTGIVTAGTWQGSDINAQYLTPDVCFRAYRTSNQLNIADSTTTKIELDTENFDVGNDFDSTTNYQFTAPVAGYYYLSGQVTYTSVVADKGYYAVIVPSTAPNISGVTQASFASTISARASDIRYLAQSETVNLSAYHAAGVGTVDVYGNISYTWLSGYLLGT